MLTKEAIEGHRTWAESRKKRNKVSIEVRDKKNKKVWHTAVFGEFEEVVKKIRRAL